MKRNSLILMLTLSMVLSLCLAGCKKGTEKKISSFDKTAQGILVYADGCVQDAIYDDFDTERYDMEEFKALFQAELDEYNASHDFVAPAAETSEEGEVISAPRASVPIAITSCEVKNNMINCQILYASTTDYLNYQEEEIAARGGNTLQTGGLLFADTSVTGASFLDTDGEALEMEKILTGKHAEEYYYVICNFESVIFCEGEVCGYTASGKYNSANDCVSVPAGETVVILFRK